MSRTRGIRRSAIVADIAVALGAPATALIVAEFIHSLLGYTRLSLLFLAAVTVTASVRGSRAALIAAIVGVLCYKFFLDVRTIEETSPLEDVINLVIFLVVALITGTLAGKVHDEAAKSRRHADRMELLFRASRVLSEEEEDRFWGALAETVARTSGGAALALDASGAIRGQSGDVISAAIQIGRQALQSPSSSIVREGSWRAQAIRSETCHAGILIWETQEADKEIEAAIVLIAELAAASLARAHLRREQVRIDAAEEAGRLREALLSSISHDFRSPLAAIIGSSTSLLEYGSQFDQSVRQDLLLNIQDEGEKLNHFVTNLLDMSRLQSGVVRPVAKTLIVIDVVEAAVERLQRHKGQALQVRMNGNCEVEADPLLLEQAVYNILDNAVKYGNPAAGLEIVCTTDEASCQIVIADHGPGLAEEDLSEMFTRFHFAGKTGQSAGTGLGLSISRGFIEAMGGTIEARRRSDDQSGLELVINLPTRC